MNPCSAPHGRLQPECETSAFPSSALTRACTGQLKAALRLLEELVGRYNSLVQQADKNVTKRLVFTVVAVGLTVVAPLLSGPLASILFAVAAASSTVQLARFATLDRSVVIHAGEAAPAAMFHEIERL